MLEHLSYDDFRIAIRNVYKLLKPGGIFRSVVPDIEVMIKGFMESNEANRAFNFVRSTGLGRLKRPKSIIEHLRAMVGNSSHLWMWDYSSLELELVQAGFDKIRSASFNDSNDEMLAMVESQERWKGAIGFNCIKSD